MPSAKKKTVVEPAQGQWMPDIDELGALEIEEFCAELGIEDPADVKARPVAGMCLAAVLIARRTYPDIPVDRWKTLRMKDLNLEALTAAQGDPTQPA
jgi:hypothetical protein